MTEDELLVSRIMAGDQDAANSLEVRFKRGIYQTIQRMVHDRETIEDLSQETFLVVYKTIMRGDLRDANSLPAFILRTAQYVTIAHFRRNKKSDVSDGFNPDEVPENSLYADPESQLLQTEMVDLAVQTIKELRLVRDRQLLHDFLVKDEEKATICKKMGLTALQFNRIYHRARERYKALYLEKLRETSKD